MNGSPAAAARLPLGVERQARADRLGSQPASSAYADWEAFVRFCEELGFGEVERLKIQDGRPVLAEVVTKKIRFTR